jgi:phosphatidylinositol 4-kinase
MSRNINAINPRFRLLTASLTMIQGDAVGSRISKNILRQRIYSVAFDYFSLAPQTPMHSGAQLANDIRSLVNFWQTVYADSKYVRKESFVTNGLYDTICLLKYTPIFQIQN